MPSALSFQLIGEASEDELLRSTAQRGVDVGVTRSCLAKAVGSGNVDYISVQPFVRDDLDNTEATDTNADHIDGWWVSAVPDVVESEWYTEEFTDFDTAMARAKVISQMLGGRPVYIE